MLICTPKCSPKRHRKLPKATPEKTQTGSQNGSPFFPNAMVRWGAPNRTIPLGKWLEILPKAMTRFGTPNRTIAFRKISTRFQCRSGTPPGHVPVASQNLPAPAKSRILFGNPCCPSPSAAGQTPPPPVKSVTCHHMAIWLSLRGGEPKSPY